MSETESEVCGYCGQQKRGEKSMLNPNECQCPNASDSKDPNIRLGAVPSSAFKRTSIVPPQNETQTQSQTQTETSTAGGLVEIISIREKHGYFRKSIPRLPLPLSIILCIFNVLLPGFGTLLSVFGVLCGCKTEHNSKRKSACCTLMAAFLQVLTTPIIVGWIWSILWGITFVNISMSKDSEDTSPTSML